MSVALVDERVSDRGRALKLGPVIGLTGLARGRASCLRPSVRSSWTSSHVTAPRRCAAIL